MYFFTICVQAKKCLFGDILDEEMILNDAGKMIDKEWKELPNRFKNIEFDEYLIMPNHFHGIIVIDDSVDGQAQGTAPTVDCFDGPENVGVPLVGTHALTLGNIIGAFKSITTNSYIKGVRNNNWQPFIRKLWQRNYFEHIIRNEKSLDNIRGYIVNNPRNRHKDEMFIQL